MSLFWLFLLAIGVVALGRSFAVVNVGLSEAGLRGTFFERHNQVDQEAYYKTLTTHVQSDKDEEKYRWLGSVPPMREWGTGRLARGLNSESYNVENLKYESTIEVDTEEIEDDQTGQIMIRVQEMGEQAANHKDHLLEQLIINGESSGFNSYDGVPFFSDSHESGGSGTQSNKLTYSATDADNPTHEEFRKALGQAIAQIVSYKDDQGQPLRIKPRPEGFVCVVPPSMLITAMEALDMQFAATTPNVMQSNIFHHAASVIAMPGLTDASKWYLFKTDVTVRPFIFQDMVPVTFGALEANSDEGFMRDKYIYGVRARYRMAYGYWYYAIRTDFV